MAKHSRASFSFSAQAAPQTIAERQALMFQSTVVAKRALCPAFGGCSTLSLATTSSRGNITRSAQVMLMVARLESFNLTLFVFQTMRTEAQSTSKEGLPFRVMLTQMILDVGAVAKRQESMLMQLSPINSVTCWRSLAHGSGSQHPEVVLWHLDGLTGTVEEMEHRIVRTVERAIFPIITSLAAMRKRLEEIESMQLELKKAHDMGREGIIQRIDDVELDLVKEMKKKAR
ncbi:hypothetical protein CJ030_MR4G025773 [Morella rubra]|uniref:Uncharacterized protein n=1 Tax=Morella rubra TaxID=262757 RepID=A0A6A1VUH6_9ROSI|nr:hypothetical protein CJ030_MR4G025773 [Morella rubra]